MSLILGQLLVTYLAIRPKRIAGGPALTPRTPPPGSTHHRGRPAPLNRISLTGVERSQPKTPPTSQPRTIPPRIVNRQPIGLPPRPVSPKTSSRPH
jgi:hypothetical protein